jgi:2-polyprenyl-6-methoxyphenol hydroxylase-like FAD-dependent oxidoreductase
MKVIISGGGICGLTLAVTAKQAGLVPIVIEKSANVYAQTFGGGIGLWPPSQMVYEQLGLLEKLK